VHHTHISKYSKLPKIPFVAPPYFQFVPTDYPTLALRNAYAHNSIDIPQQTHSDITN